MRKFKKIIILMLALIMALGVSVVGFGCGTSAQNVTEYTIKCDLDDNIITGECTADFYNDTDNAFDELKFNLYANAFREGAKFPPCSEEYKTRAYPDGINYGGIEIDKATSKGKTLEFSVGGEDMNILTVKLKEECYPEERVEVTINYEITLAKTVARTGINKDTVNLANFYPILCGIEKGSFYECVYYYNGDPYFSDCANYQVEFTCDSKYVVASSGEEISCSQKEEKTVRNYKIDKARSFALVLSEKFKIKTAEYDGVKINYYYYNTAYPERSIGVAKESIEYFSKTFGKYPYKTYSVVETEFLQGGMEFPALTMISDTLSENENIEVIVHETAHEWWCVGVGNNEIKYGFLDEGLAEYSVVMFYETHNKYGLTRNIMVESAEKTFKAFCSVYDKLYNRVDTSMLRSIPEYSSEYEYVNIAYIKPVIMYDTLRKTIGDKKFFASLKKYYEEYSFKNATPDDLVGVFEKTGADTNGYFESFFNGKALI